MGLHSSKLVISWKEKSRVHLMHLIWWTSQFSGTQYIVYCRVYACGCIVGWELLLADFAQDCQIELYLILLAKKSSKFRIHSMFFLLNEYCFYEMSIVKRFCTSLKITGWTILIWGLSICRNALSSKYICQKSICALLQWDGIYLLPLFVLNFSLLLTTGNRYRHLCHHKLCYGEGLWLFD